VAVRAEDQRVVRTIAALRKGYTDLLSACGMDQITVKGLCSYCRVDRKTFYLHYKNLDDLKHDIIDDAAEGLCQRLKGDLKEDIGTIYDFFDSNDGIYQLITHEGQGGIRGDFLHRIFSSDAFSGYGRGADQDIVEGYLYSIFYIYSDNRKRSDPVDTRRLCDLCFDLIRNGLKKD